MKRVLLGLVVILSLLVQGQVYAEMEIPSKKQRTPGIVQVAGKVAVNRSTKKFAARALVNRTTKRFA